MDDPHAEIRAGGSADPDERGPGSGVAESGSQLTGAAQTAANDLIDGLEGLTNHAFDVGETGLKDVLQIVDALQTGVSNATSAIASAITGADVGELPTIPTTDIGTGLTGEAQQYANKALNAVQTFANEMFDIGEEGIEEALKVVDEAQVRVTSLFSHLAQKAAKLTGPPKG